MTKQIPQPLKSADLTPNNKHSVTLDKGDICVAATYAVGEPDIRRNMGDGRILVYTRDLKLKGALWTGETGLVIGVEYNPLEQALYASDMTSRTVKRFGRDGTLLSSHPDEQGQPFSTMAFCKNGSLIIGEHVHGERPPFVANGDICSFDKNGKAQACYRVEHDPGKFGFHAVTNLTLSEDEAHIYYVSETGKRVMCYDIEAGKQRSDLFAFGGEDEKFTAGLDRTPDNNLLISHVYGASLFDLDGCVLKTYDDIPKDRGWAAITVCADGASFLIGNFFTGRMEKRDLETGELLGAVETNLVYKLSEMCEIV